LIIIDGTVIGLESMEISAIRPIGAEILKRNGKNWVWFTPRAIYEWVRVWTRRNL